MIRINMSGERELIARLHNAARRAPSVMRTSLRHAVKPLQTDLRDAAPVRTGATRRSIRNVSRRDGLMVGVRPNFVDPRTEKKPTIYAARVNANTDWFGGIWKTHEFKVQSKLMKSLNDNLIKKGL